MPPSTNAENMSAMSSIPTFAWGGSRYANSSTEETDGKLPSGEPLKRAIFQVDCATDALPAYFMVNCVYPTHFERDSPGWTGYLGCGPMPRVAIMKSSTRLKNSMTEIRLNWDNSLSGY